MGLEEMDLYCTAGNTLGVEDVWLYTTVTISQIKMAHDIGLQQHWSTTQVFSRSRE
jgi:hypothetical protein